jgi:hypothetical protein
MSTGRLHDFATSVIARGQVTFGDVRRLQRDCLPGGITNREDAELLVALSERLVRADKAWAQWLVAALASWLASADRCDASIQDAAKAWLESLPDASPEATRFGRQIGRRIRRELTKLMTPETEPTPEPPANEPPAITVNQPSPARARRKARPIVGSQIAKRPSRRPATSARRKAEPMPTLPVEVWQIGAIAKHLRFQLERPCI